MYFCVGRCARGVLFDLRLEPTDELREAIEEAQKRRNLYGAYDNGERSDRRNARGLVAARYPTYSSSDVPRPKLVLFKLVFGR
jgi:hypothetical protein